MVARVSIAFLVALVLIALGVTIRFGGSGEEIEVALYFELRGEVPGHEFHLGDRSFAAPVLLPVYGADPGHIDGPYDGTIVPLDLQPVPVEVFFRPEDLLVALRPGCEFVALVREGVGRLSFGSSELFWVGSSIVAREPDGRERSYILLGLGADDVARCLPDWLDETRAVAIPVDRPPGSPALLARFTPHVIHYDGPIDRPERFTERIQAALSLDRPAGE